MHHAQPPSYKESTILPSYEESQKLPQSYAPPTYHDPKCIPRTQAEVKNTIANFHRNFQEPTPTRNAATHNAATHNAMDNYALFCNIS